MSIEVKKELSSVEELNEEISSPATPHLISTEDTLYPSKEPQKRTRKERKSVKEKTPRERLLARPYPPRIPKTTKKKVKASDESLPELSINSSAAQSPFTPPVVPINSFEP